jgi:signal peptidase II
MRVLWLSALIVLIDQVTKVLVHFTMYRGQSIEVVELLGMAFRLTYTENPGMAFGLQFGPPGTVTVFALVASGLIVYYLWQIRHTYRPYRLGLGFILGGAIGNIIDRVFYGAIFYAEPLFLGRVVDFIHFDVYRGFWPDWVPFVGGNGIALFPIGNIADLAILAGVALVLIHQNRFHEELVAAEAAAKARQEAEADSAAPADHPPRAVPPTEETLAEEGERIENTEEVAQHSDAERNRDSPGQVTGS